MALIWLLAIPFAAGLIAWLTSRASHNAARWIVLIAMLADLGISIAGVRNSEFDYPWIPSLGIRLHLAADGLSLLFVALTAFLGILATLASWREIDHDIGFFHLNLAWCITGILAVFLAVDLFLFYFAWELMLVPMYFLIALWGHERRVYASIKFFLFTQLSGLFMLIAIVALSSSHFRVTGIRTFDAWQLLATPLSHGAELMIALGFLAAFLVKLPAFPFHPWLPDAHTEAPTAGSVILAGLMLKTGGYGLIRFAVPLFPHAVSELRPILFVLALLGILYGAILAFAQSDLKRLVAYTSVSHLGFVLLAVAVWNRLTLQGAVLTMVCHALSTGSLFILVGALQERLHTRDLDRMGGLWDTIPRLSGAATIFALASIGLPGLGDFAGEVLILFGTFPQHPLLAAGMAIGVLLATLYGLRLIQRTFQGPSLLHPRVLDLNLREALMAGAGIAALLWLGLYPQPVLQLFRPALERLLGIMS